MNPGIYLQALSYAGICCVILLLLLPSVMAWRGRKALVTNESHLVPGGNSSLALIGFIAMGLLIIAIIN